jgi:hypothetical protein
MYLRPHVKYRLFLSDFNESLIFSTDFRKILKYEVSWRSVQWQPSCSMVTNGQTDRQTWQKLIVAFRYFANALKIGKSKAFFPEAYICLVVLHYCLMKDFEVLDLKKRPAHRAVPPVVDEHWHGLFNDTLSFSDRIHFSSVELNRKIVMTVD